MTTLQDLIDNLPSREERERLQRELKRQADPHEWYPHYDEVGEEIERHPLGNAGIRRTA